MFTSTHLEQSNCERTGEVCPENWTHTKSRNYSTTGSKFNFRSSGSIFLLVPTSIQNFQIFWAEDRIPENLELDHLTDPPVRL
jgi:hypothetical protein